MVEVPIPVFFPQTVLHGRDKAHEIEESASFHRVSHGDIDVFDGRGDRIQYRDQKALVGEYHRVRIILQEGRKQFGLACRGRHADDLDAGNAQVTVVQLEGLSQLTDIPGYEQGGVVAWILQQAALEIPDERTDPGPPHLASYGPLALVKGVQSHEYEFFGLWEAS